MFQWCQELVYYVLNFESEEIEMYPMSIGVFTT